MSEINHFSIVTLILFCLSAIFVIQPLSFHVPLPIIGRRRITIGLLTAPIITIIILWMAQCIGISQIRDGIVGTDGIKPYNIVILFISLSYMAITLDITGVLRAAAFWVSNKGGNNARKLYFYFYVTSTAISIVLGNDPIILSGTAFLVYYTSVTGLEPLAWLISEFAAANTASMVLFVGNPTNVVICEGFQVNNAAFTAYTILPFITGNLACYAALTFQFRSAKYVPPRLTVAGRLDPRSVLFDPVGAIVGSILLLTCLTVTIVLSFFHVDVWKIVLPFAVAKFIFDLSWDHYRFLIYSPKANQLQEDRVFTQLKRALSMSHDIEKILDFGSGYEESVAGSEKTTSPADVRLFPRLDTVGPTDSPKPITDQPQEDRVSTQLKRELSLPHDTERVLDSGPGCEENVVSSERSTSPASLKRKQAFPFLSRFFSREKLGRVDSPKSITNRSQRGNVVNSERSTCRALLKEKLADVRLFPHLFSRDKFNSIYKSLAAHFPTFFTALPRLPFALIPFAFSQFILIEGLAHQGWIDVFATWLVRVTNRQLIPTVWFVGVLGVILCNVAGTNIGATILLTKVVHAAPEFPAGSARAAAIALAVASNIGAVSFTFSASLAGLLWNSILRQKGINIKQSTFAFWNCLPLLVMTVVGLAIVTAEMSLLY